MGSPFSDLNDEGYWIPLCGFRDLVMFKKDQILVLICIGLMIQLGKSSPSTRYAAESEMKGHAPMMEESTDSTASGADREKQFFDFYVQPGYEPKPHYVQPKYEPEPPKEYIPEPPKEYKSEPPKEYIPEPPKHGYKPVEEDMDTYVEDDNSYEVIPEVHEPPKHEGKNLEQSN